MSNWDFWLICSSLDNVYWKNSIVWDNIEKNLEKFDHDMSRQCRTFQGGEKWGPTGAHGPRTWFGVVFFAKWCTSLLIGFMVNKQGQESIHINLAANVCGWSSGSIYCSPQNSRNWKGFCPKPGYMISHGRLI